MEALRSLGHHVIIGAAGATRSAWPSRSFGGRALRDRFGRRELPDCAARSRAQSRDSRGNSSCLARTVGSRVRTRAMPSRFLHRRSPARSSRPRRCGWRRRCRPFDAKMDTHRGRPRSWSTDSDRRSTSTMRAGSRRRSGGFARRSATSRPNVTTRSSATRILTSSGCCIASARASMQTRRAMHSPRCAPACPAGRILYSGTNLNAADFEWLDRHDIQMNLDSLDQLRDAIARTRRNDVGLRLLIDGERSGNRIGVTHRTNAGRRCDVCSARRASASPVCTCTRERIRSAPIASWNASIVCSRAPRCCRISSTWMLAVDSA